ncbi:hypothetical protein BU23DRAFT_459433 [Bimuria novae-zelandiae CBS 107.79]|uniref:Rhodopsin domain-containing protein n=1 Tax=Bimuria novae-zelandiae CBS 107.79 TaxID=1447943 RepID=A0A6A5VDX7_9PLEO|nr:hypothetical protein BU23DRAFT_459433 [Bimuria novae-zelandiae CBS 107.79]
MTSEQWPNKGGEVIRVAIAMAILSALSTIWRLALRFRVSPWMGLSDWLMLAGTTTSFVCNIPFIIRAANAGAGRFMADPFWTADRTSTFIQFEFITICLQMYAMFLVKLSICSYLLALDFSRKFRVIIWFITSIVVTFNLIMPLLMHFASCRPFYFRWNPEIEAECWPMMVGKVTEYAQIVSNICTDLVYASAPLVCFRRADLTNQMRFKVRLMFLLALAGTAASVVKMVKLHQWLHSNEPFYDIADLAIWGINEIAICIIVANLPIQRKSICSAVALVVPEHLHSRFGLESGDEHSEDEIYQSTRENTRQTPYTAPEMDDGSEMAIIQLENGRIVMAPTTPGPAVVRESGSQGTLTTFWNNDSKDSFT